MVDDELNIKSLWGNLPLEIKLEFIQNLTKYTN